MKIREGSLRVSPRARGKERERRLISLPFTRARQNDFRNETYRPDRIYDIYLYRDRARSVQQSPRA